MSTKQITIQDAEIKSALLQSETLYYFDPDLRTIVDAIPIEENDDFGVYMKLCGTNWSEWVEKHRIRYSRITAVQDGLTWVNHQLDDLQLLKKKLELFYDKEKKARQ